MSVKNLLQFQDLSLLFVAPPAWGKTALVRSLIQNINRPILYVSPLRALAREFYDSIKNDFKVLYREKMKDGKFYENYHVIVGTPEVLLFDMAKFEVSSNCLVIIDEIHLFYLWGKSFRECLLEFLEFSFYHFDSVFCLSATMSAEVLKCYQAHVELGFSENFILNIGNFTLKNHPQFIWNLTIFSKKFQQRIYKIFVSGQNKGDCTLIFVKYREEVTSWLQWASKKGIKAFGCKGGEADEFSRKMSVEGTPQLIIATKVLSHGVNLPVLRGVIFSYDEKESEMSLQMLARGGRKGESFFVLFPKKREVRPTTGKLHHFYFFWRVIWNGIRRNYFKQN